MKKHEYVKKNINDIRILIRNGILSSKILTEFDIYNKFQSYSSIKFKEQRYQNVADDLKVSTKTVKRAIKEMNRAMKTN